MTDERKEGQQDIDERNAYTGAQPEPRVKRKEGQSDLKTFLETESGKVTLQQLKIIGVEFVCDEAGPMFINKRAQPAPPDKDEFADWLRKQVRKNPAQPAIEPRGSEALRELIAKWEQDMRPGRGECAAELKATLAAATAPVGSEALEDSDVLSDVMEIFWPLGTTSDQDAQFDKQRAALKNVLTGYFVPLAAATAERTPPTGASGEGEPMDDENEQIYARAYCALHRANFRADEMCPHCAGDYPFTVVSQSSGVEPITSQMMSAAFAASINNTDPEHGHLYDHRIAAEFLNKKLADRQPPTERTPMQYVDAEDLKAAYQRGWQSAIEAAAQVAAGWRTLDCPCMAHTNTYCHSAAARAIRSLRPSPAPQEGAK